jgi:transcriptional regulator with XRE-family HTH domain
MTRQVTTYESFRDASAQNRRLLRQEELILEVTEALSEALAREGVTKAELARRLGKTKGFVSQILAGGRNLTLRTVADVADVLGCRVRVEVLSQNEVGRVPIARTSVLVMPVYPTQFDLVTRLPSVPRHGIGDYVKVAA